MSSFIDSLPPDLFDKTTLISLASTVAILLAALLLSRLVLDKNTPGSLRFLFVWHAFDALIHFCLEGSFVYLCLFASKVVDVDGGKGEVIKGSLLGEGWEGYFPSPYNYLGADVGRVVHGAQAWVAEADGGNVFAKLWMVYAKADRRWAGVDLTVLSLELLTVFVVGPLCCLVCYDIAKKNARANIIMIILATAEIYGGFMTFCPEWLTGDVNLDTSNWMYLWLYLFFFNTLWVWIPLYSIWYASKDIMDAFRVRSASFSAKKVS